MCNNMAAVEIKSHLMLIFTFICLLLVAGEDNTSTSQGQLPAHPQLKVGCEGRCQQQCTCESTQQAKGHNRAHSQMSISRLSPASYWLPSSQVWVIGQLLELENQYSQIRLFW